MKNMKAFHEVRSYPSDFKVWHGRYHDISFIAHWHQEIELIYVRSGVLEVQAANHGYTARTGDLVICDSGDIHHGNQTSDNLCLDFLLFDTGIVSSHFHYNFFTDPILTQSAMRHSALDKDWERLLQVLDRELPERKPFYQDIVRAEIRSFWYKLLRLLPVSAPQTIMQNRQAELQIRLQELLTWLEDNSTGNITLADAADKMGFSPCHFSKLFRQMTGTGFTRYLNVLRISNASRQLLETGHKMTDIALSCGFNNIRTFNRVFLEVTGLTPTEYLKKPESQSENFTYYRSGTSIETRPEDNPTIKK
jgi:AraC-like DNA-binding protein